MKRREIGAYKKKEGEKIEKIIVLLPKKVSRVSQICEYKMPSAFYVFQLFFKD